MYIEYYCNSIDEKDIDIKKNIEYIQKFPISGILCPIYYYKFFKKNTENRKTKIGTLVDYPLAFNDSNRRQDLVSDSVKTGCDFIAISIPFHLMINRKYDKLRDDIKKNLDLCGPAAVDIRYILEYRKFDHGLLTKACEILMQGGIGTVYPSTGFFIDNLEDNIIACSYLKEKTGINTIINGNIWHEQQMKSIIKAKAYGLSINNTFALNYIDSSLYE